MASGHPFAQFDRERYMSLTTFKKNGEGVAVPVWLLPRDGKLYVWANAESFKVKRLRRDPRCEMAPCNASGKKILGVSATGSARFVDGAEADAIVEAAKARYGVHFAIIAFINKLRGIKTYTVIEISPA